jgi:hypothetical protein
VTTWAPFDRVLELLRRETDSKRAFIPVLTADELVGTESNPDMACLAGHGAPGPQVALAGAATGAAALVTGLGPAALAFPGAVLCGTTSICLIALANTLTQLASPADLRGGVMGAWTMAMPLTGLCVGAVADSFGPRWVLSLIALCFVGCSLITWRPLTRPGGIAAP